MKFSYNWLKELVPFKESPQQLAEFLTMRVFEVEGVEKAGNDWILDVSGKTIGPRMADASGHLGMAREIASLKNVKIKPPAVKITEDTKRRAGDLVAIKVESKDDCPRYTARVMTGVKVAPSPAWMRERLQTCGLQSINNIVDAANYVMLETGQPLHVFDCDKLHAASREKKMIVVRRARKREAMPALDDKTYTLNPDILVIADAKNPIAIAGIKGGRSSGVSDKTHIIIIEAANFNPAIIRHASQTLALRTDASVRFEHGLDPNQTRVAADRLAQVIQEIAGGTILGGAPDIYPRKERPVKILFRPEYAMRLIGTAIPQSFYPEAFRRLGFAAAKKGNAFLVRPPSIRRDIQIEEDIIEEIARLWDYKNVNAVMPEIPLASNAQNDELFWEERVRDIAVGMGFNETILSQFTGDRELEIFGMKKQYLLMLQNPMSPETKYLVPRILIKYVSSAADNLRHFNDVRLFGIGKSFHAGTDGAIPGAIEQKNLTVVLSQKGTAGVDEFYQLKGAVDQILESMGINDHWYDDAPETGDPRHETEIFHPYRFAEIKIGDEKIGVIGEIHPAIRETLKARARIAAAEINMEKLTRDASAQVAYRPVGKYPAIVRDIAVVVPEETRTEDVLNIIEPVGGALLIDTDLFDYFQDEALTSDEKKSLAFHLVFQSPERTLIDAEVDAVIKKIIMALEDQSWEVKK